MTWPVGLLEQHIKVKNISRQLEEIQSSRRSVVIHNYFEPNQAAWELAYISQRNGTLPIPPGTKLCWYDMRSGYIKTYTTAWDRENGKSSSGNIYAYSKNQNTDYFRFIGNIDVAGYLRGAEDNTPNLHFGLDIGKRIRQQILMLDIYFTITMPVGGVTNYLYINYGDLVTQVDVSGVLYRQVEGGFTKGVGISGAASSSSSQTQPYRASSYPSRPTSYSNQNLFGRIKVLNPFGIRNENMQRVGNSQTSVLGYLLIPANSGGVSYRQILSVKLTNLNLDQYYRIFSTTDSAGNDDNNLRAGRGWVYGYFNEPIGSLKEYE